MTDKRRIYTAECKREAVCPVTRSGRWGAEAARHLGLHARMLGRWKRAVQPIRNGAFPGHGWASLEQEEVYRWREEHGRLRTEHEICKAALGFFASESK